MLKYLFGLATFVFLLVVIRYGLKGAGMWDDKISNKSKNPFTGFNWFYRIPFSIGVIPEYFFWMTIGNNNYFKTNWWALKTSSFVTFLLFIAVLSNGSEVESYYSFERIAEHGLMSFLTSGITFWYLNLLMLFYSTAFILIVIESIRMHHWYAPVRIIIYSILSLLMSVVTFIILGLIIVTTILYIAYKIIKFLFSCQPHIIMVPVSNRVAFNSSVIYLPVFLSLIGHQTFHTPTLQILSIKHRSPFLTNTTKKNQWNYEN